MFQVRTVAVLAGALLLTTQWAAGRGSQEEEAFETRAPLPVEEKSHKVLCSYYYFGTKRDLCGDPPLEEVKKRCDEEATREHGEKTECACTQDAAYIRDACD